MDFEGQNIVLIGFMGCGKTTLGKKLANKLKYKFVDMDNEIEKMEGMTVAEIFSKNGENYFREKERSLLKSYLQTDHIVLSTGGGAPCFNDNMNLINKIGRSIYIKLSPKTLFSRLKSKSNKRPLLHNLSDTELLTFIETSLSKRAFFYEQALVSVSSEKELFSIIV